jgi:hypothetical protein
MGHPHTSPFLCAKFWTNIFQAAGLAVAHRHLRHHFHGHHIALTLPPQTVFCGVLSREGWLRVAITPTKICADLWKTAFVKLLQKCSNVWHRGHAGTSVCVSSIAVHIRFSRTCNQDVRKWFKLIMTDYGSVLVGVRWLLAHTHAQCTVFRFFNNDYITTCTTASHCNILLCYHYFLYTWRFTYKYLYCVSVILNVQSLLKFIIR